MQFKQDYSVRFTLVELTLRFVDFRPTLKTCLYRTLFERPLVITIEHMPICTQLYESVPVNLAAMNGICLLIITACLNFRCISCPAIITCLAGFSRWLKGHETGMNFYYHYISWINLQKNVKVVCAKIWFNKDLSIHILIVDRHFLQQRKNSTLFMFKVEVKK